MVASRLVLAEQHTAGSLAQRRGGQLGGYLTNRHGQTRSLAATKTTPRPLAVVSLIQLLSITVALKQ